MHAYSKKKRSYDSRIKLCIVKSGDPNLFPNLGIPKNTIRNWLRSGMDGLSHIEDDEVSDLRWKVQSLERELTKLRSQISLREEVSNILGCVPLWDSLRDPAKKVLVLKAIDKHSEHLSISERLAAISLKYSRYKYWRLQRRPCLLDPSKECRKTYPQSLTKREVKIMKEMICSRKYAHFSIRSLSLFAQREGYLWCCRHTWYRYRRMHGWKRPHRPVYHFAKREGIKATSPNQIWHIDSSLIRTQRGHKCYLQAITDNFSRKVLAWKVSSRIDGINTAQLIREAARITHCEKSASRQMETTATAIMMDPGGENINHEVDAVFKKHSELKRLIAQVDIHFSNARSESVFRSLKTNFLRHQRTRSLQDLRRQVRFYLTQYNEFIPHNSFHGATPSEIYEGRWSDAQTQNLVTKNRLARRLRVAENQVVPCVPACSHE